MPTTVWNIKSLVLAVPQIFQEVCKIWLGLKLLSLSENSAVAGQAMCGWCET